MPISSVRLAGYQNVIDLLNIQSVFVLASEVKQVLCWEKFQKYQLLLYGHLKFSSIRQFELLAAFKEFLLIIMNKKPYF
jgi:hypothetical protein